MLWEEWHVAAETDGGFPQSAYRGVHTAPAAPSLEQLLPLPERDRIKIAGHTHVAGWDDYTPFAQGNHELCVAYGFGFWDPPANTRPRYDCPFGADLTPERLARERWAMGGDSVCQARGGGAAVRNPDNWLQCGCNGACTGTRLCSADLSVCSDWIAR